MSKKETILSKAIELFNLQGYESITLLELAKYLDMSRGNLAYHFPDKPKILEGIAEMLEADINSHLSARNELPSFSNFQIAIKIYFDFNQKYAFIFNNTKMLEEPFLKEVIQRWSKSTIAQFRDSFAFGIQVGNMKPEPVKGIYENLAVNTWMVIYFWLAQKKVRGEKELDNAEKMVWASIIPHFTDKGFYTFQKHFGEDFVNNLGTDFNQHSNNFSIF